MNTFNLRTLKISLCLELYKLSNSWISSIVYINRLHGCTERIFKIIISDADFPIVCCILICFIGWSRPPCSAWWTCTCYLVTLKIVIKYSCWPESIIVSINSNLTPTRILNHNICWVYPRIIWTFKYNFKSYSIRVCYISN